MDKLMCMKVFAAVARCGSFSAAATELKISRAMASKYIGSLENNLNVRLLNRTTRHLSLTEVGRAYQEKVSMILAEIDETESAVTSLHAEPRGKLKILAPPSFGSFHLARVFTAYQQRYPEIMIDMLLTDQTLDLFEEEGIDLAIALGNLEDSNLVAKKIASARIVVCAAPDYFTRHGTPSTPADLKNHNCLRLARRQNALAEWKFVINGEETILYPHGNLMTNTADPLRVAAIQGAGLIQLPSYMVGLDIQSGKLVPVLQEYEPEQFPIYAVYLHRKHLSTKVRTFVDFIYQHFQPTPYWDLWIKPAT